MPTRIGRRPDGTFRREYYCDSCEMLGINGMACHETGCPDAWKDYKIACFQCGCDFQRENRHQAVCRDCIEDNERRPEEDDDHEPD